MNFRFFAFLLALVAALALIGPYAIGFAIGEDTPIVIGDGSFFVESPKMKFSCWEKTGNSDELGHADRGGAIRNIRITKGDTVEFDGACKGLGCRMEVDYSKGKVKLRVLPRFNNGQGFVLKFLKPAGAGSWKPAGEFRREFDDQTDPDGKITSVAFDGRDYCTSSTGKCRIELNFTPAKPVPAKCR